MVAIESVTCIIGYFHIFRRGIRRKHLKNVEYQVFQNIHVCIDTYINIDIQRYRDI